MFVKDAARNDPRRHNSASEDEVMEPRIDLLSNEIGAKIGKRIYNVSLAIEQSPLPKPTQELVALRASQINGCGPAKRFR